MRMWTTTGMDLGGRRQQLDETKFSTGLTRTKLPKNYLAVE